MMSNSYGASPLATGLSPSVEPVPVSPAAAASIPSAEEALCNLIAAIEFECPAIIDGVDVEKRASILLRCAKKARAVADPDANPSSDPVLSRKSWVWDYALSMGKALIGVAPGDFTMSLTNTASMRVECTIHNDYEAEAVREIIAHMAKTCLSAHREMIREDIYPPSPKPTFREELDYMLGPASAIEVRQGGDGKAGSVHESAAPKADAQPQDPTP